MGEEFHSIVIQREAQSPDRAPAGEISLAATGRRACAMGR
jgi:hypothetical protein